MAIKQVAFCDICGEEIPRPDGSVLVVDGHALTPKTYGNFDLCGQCNRVIDEADKLNMIILCFTKRKFEYKNK